MMVMTSFSWLPINCNNTMYIPWDPFMSFFCCFSFLGFCFPSSCIWIGWGGCWCGAHAYFFLTFILTRSTTDVNNYIFLRINTNKVATLKGQVTAWWGGNIYWFKPFLVGKPWWRILLTVVLLQKVLISPGTHRVNKLWVPLQNHWVPVQKQ